MRRARQRPAMARIGEKREVSGAGCERSIWSGSAGRKITASEARLAHSGLYGPLRAYPITAENQGLPSTFERVHRAQRPLRPKWAHVINRCADYCSKHFAGVREDARGPEGPPGPERCVGRVVRRSARRALAKHGGCQTPLCDRQRGVSGPARVQYQGQ